MTQDDLNQIRAMMREEVRGIVREEVRGIVREEVRGIVREEVRGIVREEIAANNETLTAAFRSELTAGLDGLRTEFAGVLDGFRREIHDHLTSVLVALRQEFAERIGAAAVSFVTDLSEVRKELGHRIDVLDDALGRRMDALERRMDRIAETTGTTATELAALTRWANRLDRENLETLNNQAAQQRAIDDLAKRLRPPGQPSI